MRRRAAVIGCGVIGAISAIELLRSGHEVTILDPADPGGEQAASFGNAGFLSVQSVLPPAEPGVWKHVPKYVLDPLGPLAIRLGYLPRVTPWLLSYLLAGGTQGKIRRTAAALNELIKGAPALHEALAAEAGRGALIERKGLLHAYLDRAAYERETFGWSLRRELNVRFEEMEGAALRARFPELPARYGFGVLAIDAGRCLDPGAYVAALATLAQNKGARLMRCRAAGIRLSGQRVEAIDTDAGAIACDAVVVAAGIHSRAIADATGDRIPLESERGYHVSVPAAGREFGVAYMANDAKMAINGMCGFVRAAGQVEFAGVDAAPNWKRAGILRTRLSQLYPDIDMTRSRLWLGHRPSTPDGLPCIGRSRRSPDVVHAFGHGHIGLVGSARTGRLVAQLLSDVTPEIDILPFSPSRFHRGIKR